MNRRAMDPKNPLPSRPASALATSLLLLASIALLSLSACKGGSAASEPPPLEGARMGGDFTLTDKKGKTVRAADFAGRYRTVYFGYTFCPDVLPAGCAGDDEGLPAFRKGPS